MDLTMDREVEIAGAATCPGSARSPPPPRSSACSGTVWGIMNSFQAIAATKNSTLAVVAPGIAEALFATALGLIAAIPAADRLQQAVGLDRQLRQPALELLRGVRGGALARARSGEGGLSAWPPRSRPARAAARRRSRRRKRTTMVEINMTPLVDVMLVLLIVFMIAAPLLTAGVTVDLPEADSAPLPGPGRALERVDRRRRRRVHPGQAVTLDQLGPRLQAITGRKPDARIFVRGDRGIDYGTVMGVVSAINQAGFGKVALLTVPGRAAAAP